MEQRRILLLGGSGQLGRELLALPWPAAFTLVAPPRAEADITDRRAIASLVADGAWATVINSAGWTGVDAAEGAKAEAFAANATGPAILAEETRLRGIPLIHVSTDYVFDGAKGSPYDEEDPTGPLGVYGASKLAGEEAVRAGNPRHVIVRTSWLFGRFGRNFVKTMLTVARDRDTVRVVDDQHGTPTAASDLASALSVIASRSDFGDLAGTYHFANGGEATWCSLARRIFALSAEKGGPIAAVAPIGTADYPTPAKRPVDSRLSTAKIERDLGIVPRSWEAALGDVIDSMLASEPRTNSGR